jgi:hypothetical protein
MINISALLDANMIGKFRYLPSLMSMDIPSCDGVTIINSEISSDMFNIVCGIREKKALRFAVEKFRDEKLPFAC